MVPRPSRRSSGRGLPARGFANPIRNMAPDIRKRVGESLRSATRQILSELQEEGPDYSGEFKRKWYSQVEGRGNKVFVNSGVPRFTDEQLRKGSPTILIGNTSPYAQEAMDLIPGKFVAQEGEPNKTPVAMGVRIGTFRGDVKDAAPDMDESSKSLAISTAEKDWYTTYMEGGRFARAFKQGAKSGFIRPVQ